jgi:hypothetical protein
MPDDAHMDEPLTPTPALPHQGGGNQRRGGLEATPNHPTVPAKRIADLQGQLGECRAERDEAIEYLSATALRTLPLDGGGLGWGW